MDATEERGVVDGVEGFGEVAVVVERPALKPCWVLLSWR